MARDATGGVGGAQRARQRHLMPGRERPLTRGDFALLFGVAIVIACWIDVAIAAPRLAFFLVADDGASTSDQSFERATITSPWGRENLMIARAPSLEIEASHITSATVERRKMGQGSLGSEGSYFALFLRIEPDTAKRIHNCTGANVGSRVDIRLDSKRLSVAKIHEATGTALMIFLTETEEERVKQLLLSISDRLSWK